MHVSSLENLRYCLRRHVATDPYIGQITNPSLLDVGSLNVNGSYREVLDLLECSYHGVDLEAGPGVDTVLQDPYKLPFDESTFDIVFSGQVFEHSEFFWKLFADMCRVVKENGLIIVLTPSNGPIHRFPVDCYRFNPDSMAALALHTNVQLVDAWASEFGPFYETAGVFRKCDPNMVVEKNAPDLSLRFAQPVQNNYPTDVPEEVEHGSGSEDRYPLLERAHSLLKPRFYLEIGVEYGKSLRLADCPAIGIDPAPQLNDPIDPRHVLSLTTSDDFFRLTDGPSRITNLDLVYIDGMHQIEYVLREFMFIERCAHAGTVVIIDDVFPAHPLQGERIRQSRFWAGDVWKVIPILRATRPDLLLVPLDTSPTGSLMVLGCDPQDRRLWEKYDILVDWAIRLMVETPESIVSREGALDPRDPLVTRILRKAAERRDGDDMRTAVEELRVLIRDAMPRKIAQ